MESEIIDTMMKEYIEKTSNRKIKKLLVNLIKIKWIFFKLLIFITLLIFAITIKLSRQIIHGILECIDYITNLGNNDINGKILLILENVKITGREINTFFQSINKKDKKN